jgi:hypothetical protein
MKQVYATKERAEGKTNLEAGKRERERASSGVAWRNRELFCPTTRFSLLLARSD